MNNLIKSFIEDKSEQKRDSENSNIDFINDSVYISDSITDAFSGQETGEE